MSKLAIVLCTVLFASAANAFLMWSHAVETAQNTAKDVTHDMIRKVERQLNDMREAVVPEFDRLFNVTIDFGHTVWEEITEITQNATAEIRKYSDITKSVNVSECLEFSEHIIHIAKAAVSKTGVCIAKELETGYRHINNINEAANDIINKLINISSEVRQCADNADTPKLAIAAINCAQGASADATWAFDKFHLEVAASITDLNLLLEALTPNVNQCTLRNGYATVREKSATVVERTKSCMQRIVAESRNNA